MRFLSLGSDLHSTSKDVAVGTPISHPRAYSIIVLRVHLFYYLTRVPSKIPNYVKQ